MRRLAVLLALASLALALPPVSLEYYVLVLDPSGTALGYGIYTVRFNGIDFMSSFNWIQNPTYYCSPQACAALQALLNPPAKFLAFTPTGKYVGPGALGFPNGIIPCDKYLVQQDGIEYTVCAYKNVIVYEEYFKDVAEQVSLKPTPQALQLVPFIVDPAPPAVRAFLTAVMITVSVTAVYVFMKRDEIRVL
ncbi:hypothetical protein IPA_05980 [Ignicoccus pacificus DSM 13166]|uniref:Uncharacterized protein n=1 Tax=Ignicoccus pacificus DSM 13166 TaxID=940294 RepID=A0A977KBC4_9CREN|nr:hypothetical protein IPA_05980 [Ignicoccus pacificus DSM 13166]